MLWVRSDFSLPLRAARRRHQSKRALGFIEYQQSDAIEKRIGQRAVTACWGLNCRLATLGGSSADRDARPTAAHLGAKSRFSIADAAASLPTGVGVRLCDH
jgi:hypothetical protein